MRNVEQRLVTLVAHYEPSENGQPTWWAESEDFPGFTAVYPSLGELQREAEAAVKFALDTDEVDFEWQAAAGVPPWAYVHITYAQPGLVLAGYAPQVQAPSEMVVHTFTGD